MRPRWQWRQGVPVSSQTMRSQSLRELHERLVRFGSDSDPASDADAPWQDLRRKLPDRPLSRSGRLMAWLRRPAVVMMTTGLLSTGVAHAAGVRQVRSGVDWVLGGVTSIVGGKSEARDESGASPVGHRRPSDGGARPSEENRRLFGGVGLGHDGEENDAPGGRGGSAPGGAGAVDDEDPDESRDDDGDERERDDDGDERERDDDDERERDDDGADGDDRNDIDDEGRSGPDDEEPEEPDDERGEADRDVDAEERDDLEGDAHEEVDPEEDGD